MSKEYMHSRLTSPSVKVHAHNEGFETVFQDSLSREMAGGQWQHLVADIGANTAYAVQQVTGRLTELAAKGRIAESDVRWLLNPLQPLYHAGISAQKLSHFAEVFLQPLRWCHSIRWCRKWWNTIRGHRRGICLPRT
jgi:hypothetical protein